MMRTLFFVLTVVVSGRTSALDIDGKLALVQQVYQLSAKNCDPPVATQEQLAAGKVMFESKSLSGNRDTSCSTCHIDRFGSADGLAIAIGVGGGSGEGAARLAYGRGILVQRNAFSLMGRGTPAFTTFFWDGRVQQQGETLINPLGEGKSKLFHSPLAVAAVLPLLERDEFLGRAGLFNTNEVQTAAGDNLYNHRYLAVSGALRERFLRSRDSEDLKVARALQSVGVDLEKFELAHVSNLIALHIANKFRCKESRWDRYLHGERGALTAAEKQGALLFYGKGRCAACHAGAMMSDFQFHSIGTPQGRFGPQSRHRDVGRAHVTTRAEDLYKFRTPPLIEVGRTKPYGHNGAFGSTREVVVHHFNPFEFYRQRPDFALADYYEVGKLIAARDAILGTIEISREQELQDLLAFLEAI